MGRESEKSIQTDKKPILDTKTIRGFHQWVTKISDPLYSKFDPSYITFSTRKKMLKNPMVSLALRFETAVIATQKWKIKCEDATIATALRENLKPVYSFLVKRALKAIAYGFAPFEKGFKTGKLRIKVPRENKKALNKTLDPHVLIKDYYDLDPEHWDPKYNVTNGRYEGLKPAYSIGDEDALLPARKSFIMTNDKEFGNLRGKTRFEAVYRSWYSRTALGMFTDRYYERKADPPTRAWAPAGKSEDVDGNSVDNVPYMKQQLMGLKHGGEIILPFEIDELTKKMKYWAEVMAFPERGDLFLNYLEYLDLLILRGMLVPEKVLIQGTGRTGTFAETDVHTENAMFIFQEDANNFIEHVNLYILPQLIRYNFGVDAMERYPAELWIAGFKRVNKTLAGSIMKNLVETVWEDEEGYECSGAQLIDLQEFMESIDMPWHGIEGAKRSGAVYKDKKTNVEEGVPDAPRPFRDKIGQAKQGERVPILS